MITVLGVAALAVRVGQTLMDVWVEHVLARWLPWWRRYLSVLCWVIHWILFLGLDGFGPSILAYVVAVSVFHWNVRTALRNRDRGDDQRKREAQAGEARLTEVQAAALQREARACS